MTKLLSKMNLQILNWLKSMKRFYIGVRLKKDYSGQSASDAIFKLLNSDSPAMICRFGQMELTAIKKIIEIESKKRKYLKDDFYGLSNNAGFFPVKLELLQKFKDRTLKDIKEIDVLGSWLIDELIFSKELKMVKKIDLPDLEPYNQAIPWSRVLENKKVLVIHPFAKTIASQYKNRNKLFDDKRVLPKFELKTLTAVQSIGGKSSEFETWFDALNYMEKKISKIDFDIAIIGCGAYGFSLAAHIKRMGKKAVHLGGATQLLFGIKGKRWENSDFKFINKYWVSPSTNDKPKDFKTVEGGCYW